MPSEDEEMDCEYTDGCDEDESEEEDKERLSR